MKHGPMTLLATATRAALIEQLARAMEDSPPLDDAQFCDAIKSLTVAGVQTIDIAAVLKVATPTVTRWGQGKASPHPTSRRVYLRILPGFARTQAADLLATMPLPTPMAEAA